MVIKTNIQRSTYIVSLKEKMLFQITFKYKIMILIHQFLPIHTLLQQLHW